MASQSESPLRRIYSRYFVTAMSAMAYGLFASLIVGTIMSTLGGFGPLSFLLPLAQVVQEKAVFGAVIGAAIARSFGADGLVIFASAGAGAIGCMAGGPVGAYIGGVVGAEVGQLVSRRTPLDITVTPLVTILAGGLVSRLIGPYVERFMVWLRDVIHTSMELMPLLMGIVIAVIVGMVLTSPISSAGLCYLVGIEGLAAGAALAGCCAQMIGFAVISFGDNGVSGLISQGLGTAKLQLPNVLLRPQIWIAPTVASAVCGAFSATLFQMTCNSAGAGMGTSALVGQITTFAVMAPQQGAVRTLIAMAVLHFLMPALVALAVDRLLRRVGWVRAGDMKLQKV